MRNWIDELNGDTKGEDREFEERAGRYDEEIDEGSKRYDDEIKRNGKKYDEG